MFDFWNQFKPSIICDGIDVRTVDEISLADIERYQRFDADWLSFSEDDMPMISFHSDINSLNSPESKIQKPTSVIRLFKFFMAYFRKE